MSRDLNRGWKIKKRSRANEKEKETVECEKQGEKKQGVTRNRDDNATKRKEGENTESRTHGITGRETGLAEIQIWMKNVEPTII